MSRIKRAKPSPALILAVAALVAALAGTAVGGVAVTSLNKRDKKEVKKLAKKQAKKLDRKPLNRAQQAQVAADAAQSTADDALAALNGKTVSVGSFNADGSTRQVSGSILGAERLIPGAYAVKFDREIRSSCDVMAGPGHATAGGSGFVGLVPEGEGQPRRVIVNTRDSGFAEKDTPFTVVALC